MAFLNQVYNFGRKVLIGSSIVGGVACGADDKKDNPVTGPDLPKTVDYTLSPVNTCGIEGKSFNITFPAARAENPKTQLTGSLKCVSAINLTPNQINIVMGQLLQTAQTNNISLPRTTVEVNEGTAPLIDLALAAKVNYTFVTR